MNCVIEAGKKQISFPNRMFLLPVQKTRRLLRRIFDPDLTCKAHFGRSGRISIDGMDVSFMAPQMLRCQILFSGMTCCHLEREGDYDCDQYLLFYKGHRYILEIEDQWRKEIRDGGVFFYFKFVICSTIQNYADCPAEEVLSVLKDVLYEWGRHKGRELVFGMDIRMEIIYLGEKIYG